MLRILCVLLQFLPLFVIAENDEWFLMGRHGGCLSINSLAEYKPILQDVQKPIELVEKLRKKGDNPIVDNLADAVITV